MKEIEHPIFEKEGLKERVISAGLSYEELKLLVAGNPVVLRHSNTESDFEEKQDITGDGILLSDLGSFINHLLPENLRKYSAYLDEKTKLSSVDDEFKQEVLQAFNIALFLFVVSSVRIDLLRNQKQCVFYLLSHRMLPKKGDDDYFGFKKMGRIILKSSMLKSKVVFTNPNIAEFDERDYYFEIFLQIIELLKRKE